MELVRLQQDTTQIHVNSKTSGSAKTLTTASSTLPRVQHDSPCLKSSNGALGQVQQLIVARCDSSYSYQWMIPNAEVPVPIGDINCCTC